MTFVKICKQSTTHYPANPLVLGKFGSAYGVRGWLKLFSSTEESESIFEYKPWFIKHIDIDIAQWQHIELEGWKRHNQHIIIKVKGISNRASAALLTDCNIFVDSGQLPKLDKGDYYWKDLLGCQVVTTKGYSLGNVIDMIETGSNDVLVVKANKEDKFSMQERLIPFLNEQVIKSVDLTTSTIKVNWDSNF